MFNSNQIQCNNNILINYSINSKEDFAEDSKEDKMEVSVEEEDEVVDLCSAKSMEYWEIISDIVQTYSRNVIIVPL